MAGCRAKVADFRGKALRFMDIVPLRHATGFQRFSSSVDDVAGIFQVGNFLFQAGNIFAPMRGIAGPPAQREISSPTYSGRSFTGSMGENCYKFVKSSCRWADAIAFARIY
jgi:hypothetical protein